MIEAVVVLAVFISIACSMRWTKLRTHIVEIYVKSIAISTLISVTLALGFGLALGIAESRPIVGLYTAGTLLAIGGLPIVLLASAVGSVIGATPTFLIIRRSKRRQQ